MSAEYVKRRALNGYGVKNSADMWRTIGGVLWPHFAILEAEDQVLTLRRAGIRVRRFGEEIFVHPEDVKRAGEVDDARAAARRTVDIAALEQKRGGS